MLSLGQYIKYNNYHGTANFLHTFSEQCASFVNDDDVLKFLDENPNQTSNSIKNAIYRKYFKIRNRKKFTGFEQVAEQDEYYRNKLKELYPDNLSNIYEYKIGSLDIPPADEYEIDFRQACVKAALYHQEKASEVNKKIYVCMSGGMDSEVVAESFKLADVDFVPFIVDYQGKNSHDTAYAFTWCLENNKRATIHSLDLDKFFSDEMNHYAEKTKVTSPQILTYQKIIDIVCNQYNGYIIMAGELRVYAKEDKKVYASFAWDKGENHFNPPFNYEEK